MKSGSLLIFEGVDGVGKTTLAQEAAKTLENRGNKAIYVSFPGKDTGTLGKDVYDLYHERQNSVAPSAMQALHVAAQLDTIEKIIIPAIEDQYCVLLDRYWWSTWVYGRLYGVPTVILDKLIEAVQAGWYGIEPDAVFLVSRNIEESKDIMVLKHCYDMLQASEAPKYPVYNILNNTTVEVALNQVWKIY